MTNGSQIISIGYNTHKTHPIAVKTREGGTHAEMSAIIKARKVLGEDLSRCTLYIARWRSSGTGYCRPCKACMGVIYEHGILNIYYTLSSPYNTVVNYHGMELQWKTTYY